MMGGWPYFVSDDAVQQNFDNDREHVGEEEEGHAPVNDDEDWWHNEIGSPGPISLQYTPEKPKLLLQQIDRLETSCSLTMSCTPVSKLSPYHPELLNEQRNDQFRTDDIDIDFAIKLWMEDCKTRSSTKYEDVDPDLSAGFVMPGRCASKAPFAWVELWVERVIIFFRYLGSMSRVVFSWCEDHAQAHQLTQRTRKDMEQRD
ncbi:predicted protein [Lichtheimia corymbifera JMRC:FSU:9682]|uniref:Uncharacterized protein n=1 Tax=Lichtheimia corymbifera JMRC:FSU:9682 TaxID=1263082 RepID=A0A068RMT9_9FUNG|nr:predicted protein [Lichtheimia corymbifera JMRC:FSU:9682]